MIGLSLLTISCDTELKCEKHIFPKGFTGKVTIFYNQKGGQTKHDKYGCIEYKISENGECLSARPFIVGTTYPNQTFKYFEIISNDSAVQIYEFYEKEYLEDTLGNAQKKYIFYLGSGYEAPNYVYQYYVDYGINYRRYFHY